MRYHGPDRREHTVFLTKNREYHTRGGTCVAVRDRESTVWMSMHSAMGMQLKGIRPGERILGRKLLFASERNGVYTSPVVDILRPGRQVFQVYQMIKNVCPC